MRLICFKSKNKLKYAHFPYKLKTQSCFDYTVYVFTGLENKNLPK